MFNTIKVNNTDTGYTHSIFDISEYNSGAIYVNLSAALAAVPQNRKKGGMTVKFILTINQAQYSVVKTEGLETEPSRTLLSEAPSVDSGTYDESQLSTIFSTLPSDTGAANALTYYVAVIVDETTTYTSWVITKVLNSDNKYVQARLMSDTFNTTPANWQEVDSSLVIGSRNLIENRAVAKSLFTLNNELCGAEILDNSAFNISSKTVVTDNDYYVLKTYAIKVGDEVIYNGNFGGSTLNYGIGLVKEDGSIDTYISSAINSRELTAPDGTVMVYATIKKGTYGYLDINGIKVDYISLPKKIKENTEVIKTSNLQKVSDVVCGNIIYDKAIEIKSGSIISDSDFMIIKFPVAENDVITYLGGFSGTSTGIGIVIFKADGTIDYAITAAYASDRVITVSSTGTYAMATVKNESNVPFKVKVNDESIVDYGDIVNTKKRIDALEEEMSVVCSITSGNTTDGKAIKTDGTVVDDNDFAIITFPVIENDVISYLGGFGGGSSSTYPGRGLVVFKEDGTIDDFYISSASSLRTIIISSTGVLVKASIKKDAAFTVLKNDINVVDIGKVAELESEIAKLSKEVEKYKGNLIEGKSVDLDGNINTDADWEITYKIPVNAGDIILYTSGSQATPEGRVLAVYNENDVKISTYRAGTAIARNITAVVGASYIIASFLKEPYYPWILTVNGVNKIVESNFKLVHKMKQTMDRGYLLPINIFGDVLPPLFKEKVLAMNNDLLIACQGDSITGLIERCDVQEEPAHCPPGCQYKSWIYLLMQNISKVKPVCDRVDSQRNSVDVFTKTGTWENVTTVSAEREAVICGNDGSGYGQQRSVSALTFQCADTNAALSFELDADIYDKCNIVFSKEPDAVLTKIIISEGNGKMLVSEDRSTWVEANGFTYNQRTPVSDYSIGYADPTLGEANREPQRRLWMKKASGVTGTIHISYQRDNSTSYDNSYMYCWGIEKWSGIAVFIDNLGRGGRQTRVLKANISDIFDRHPDLAIYEMPLANEIGHSGTPVSVDALKGTDYYGSYFLGSNGDSFKLRSNDYTTMPIIVILPHGRSGYWNDNNSAIVWNGSTQDAPAGQPAAYIGYKQLFGWLQTQLKSYENVKFINMFDQLINEALVNDDSIKRGFYGSDNQITADSVHLSQYGAYLWRKYLAGIFY